MSTGQLDLDLDSEFLLVSVVQILGFSNSVCNPLVYAALNTTFKRDLLALLTRGRKPGGGCCFSSPGSCWFRRSHKRVGVSAEESVEPRRGLERTCRQGGIRSWSKLAWEPEVEKPTSNQFHPVNLLTAIRSKKSTSTMILSIIDPPHTDSTSGSEQLGILDEWMHEMDNWVESKTKKLNHNLFCSRACLILAKKLLCLQTWHKENLGDGNPTWNKPFAPYHSQNSPWRLMIGMFKHIQRLPAASFQTFEECMAHCCFKTRGYINCISLYIK